MPAIVRLGDTSDHGGKMVTATGNVTVNGKMMCVSGDMHDCPKRGHGRTAVTSPSDVSGATKSVIRVGDRAGCGAVITAGSENVTAN